MIHHHHLEQETKDLTDPNILGENFLYLYEGWFPLRKISTGLEQIGTQLNQHFRYQFSVPV